MMTNPNLHKALLAFREDVPALPKDGKNPAFKGSKYTKLDTIVEIVTPVLGKHGLTWTAFPCTYDGQPCLTYYLTHAESGEYIGDTMPLLLVKKDPQGQGSAITYARRYALCSLLNLVADEDDDGNAASKTPEAPKRSGKQTTDKPAPKPADDRPLPADLEALRAAAAKAGADWQTLGMHLVAIDVDASDGTDITKESVARAIVALTPEKYAALMGRLS